jgi:hypothetical protein
LLESDDEVHWKKWMSESKRRLQNSDFSGIEHLLSAYGGMGSFSDLVICQSTKDGGFVWKKGYKKRNNTLGKLRTKAWELATYIKRNHEIVGTEPGV